MGRLWRGRRWECACKAMQSCIPPSKLQNPERSAAHGQGLCSWSLTYLQAVPVLSLLRWGVVKIYFPINGVLGSWTVFLAAAVRPERRLLSCASQGHLSISDAEDEGLIRD